MTMEDAAAIAETEHQLFRIHGVKKGVLENAGTGKNNMSDRLEKPARLSDIFWHIRRLVKRRSQELQLFREQQRQGAAPCHDEKLEEVCREKIYCQAAPGRQRE